MRLYLKARFLDRVAEVYARLMWRLAGIVRAVERTPHHRHTRFPQLLCCSQSQCSGLCLCDSDYYFSDELHVSLIV